MMKTKNLWGTLPDLETSRTPHTVLLEQAALLRDMTNGLLIGKVERRSIYTPQESLCSSTAGGN